MASTIEEQIEAKRRKLEAKMTGGAPPSAVPSAVAPPAPVVAVSTPTPAAAEPPAAASEEPANPFVCDANDVVTFRLVSSAEEMTTAEAFEPEFTHQIFREDETIFGYKDLRVNVYATAGTFRTYVEVTYSEKVKSTLNPADDVVAALRKHFGDEMLVDRDAFLAALAKDASAPIPGGGGEVVSRWTADGDDEHECTVRVFKLADEDVYPWHARFEPFTLFYIDGASAIDTEDEKWLLFATIRASKKNPNDWTLTAFATAYQFYVYPDKTRTRLSQIVVLPPFQRKGLGGKILEAVRVNAASKGHKDVTVEDPTPQLQRLLDVSDVRALIAIPEVMTAVQRCAAKASTLSDGDGKAGIAALELPSDVAELARAKLCLCAPQMRRCWEALLFMTAKKAGAPDTSPAARAFTELVVRRLKALHCADARRDAGKKRVYPTAGSAVGFVMTFGSGAGGQGVDMEEDAEGKADPAEVLAEYFHETMSNLNWLASAVKL